MSFVGPEESLLAVHDAHMPHCSMVAEELLAASPHHASVLHPCRGFKSGATVIHDPLQEAVRNAEMSYQVIGTAHLYLVLA